MEEYEVKFLNIDKAALERKLLEIGAQKTGEYFYKRQVFDYPDLSLDAKGAWVRVRDEGDKIVMSFKQRLGMKGDNGDDDGTKEVEFEVSDFDKACQFLYDLGLIDKFYLENKRTRYVKDGIEFDIDEWSLLEPYLEIEAGSWEEVDKATAWLDLDKADMKKFSTTQIYALNGINDKDYSKLTFTEAIKK